MMRAALYWAPDVADPLHAAGSAWLGRDAETGATLPQPDDRREVTAEARSYGLHATLKPPFRLAHGWGPFMEDVQAFAARLAPFALPPLAVMDLKGFLALREAAPCAALHALADAAVQELDAHRAPAPPEELARRRRAGLSPRQEAHLADWGYPWVLDEWRFHVTLTRRLDAAERPRWMAEAQAVLGEAAARPRLVREVCVFTQAGPGAPFLVAERLPLGG
ncbi:DUF1045 domain-containing protein [Roseococcus sp. DSY-14]|uniref:DUF1045 domain-containing protein n=1 Tax=Roseococcus sp. DSY-14 TaxID=3369650 RepID=UPI00387B97D3